jgi:Ca-activated chloride channel family protein
MHYAGAALSLVAESSGAAPCRAPQAGLAWNTEAYGKVDEAAFKAVVQEPLSTFSVDVDTASYSNVRRFLQGGAAPPKDAVRVEELLNAFHYDYPEPGQAVPFSVTTEVAGCPWKAGHNLVRIGLQGRRIDLEHLPPRNLVFLVDVSGSMMVENKLPLVKQGLQRLCGSLRPQDFVSIVVYAAGTGVVLQPTSGQHKERIRNALERLEAGGGTQGSAGIQLAYATAMANFRKGADNRVLLCTDGDFNLGVTDQGSLLRMIEDKRRSGVFLTALGFGMGNLKDSTLVQLADRGNGHYAYIDSLKEMEKVFGEGGASLVTIAKDVKIQVEFNPARAKAYRLIGYEKRILAAEDFHDDAKDAGEINAGLSVTALYEVVPPGAPMALPKVDALHYQTAPKPVASGELLTVKLRFKAPDSETSSLLTFPVEDHATAFSQAGTDFRFAASVAAFGMLLRESPFRGDASYGQVLALAKNALGADARGERAEFLDLCRRASKLAEKADATRDHATAGISQAPKAGR